MKETGEREKQTMFEGRESKMGTAQSKKKSKLNDSVTDGRHAFVIH